MESADDAQITALREEIRRAGRRVGRVRSWLALMPALMLAAWAFWIYFWTSEWHNPDPDPWGWRLRPLRLLGCAFMGGSTGIVALCVIMPLAFAAAAIYRAWCRRRTCRALASLQQEKRSALLLPLRNSERGDARRLVEGLIRDFHLRTELSPAACPDARGNEASPAETAG